MAKEKKIEVDKIDLDELKEKTTDNPGLISFPHTVGSPAVKPIDKGKIKGRAMSAMHEQTEHQLHQLYEQMQVLVGQANDIKRRVEVSNRIYLAQMNFDPIIGKIYYLYSRKTGEDLLSMVAPEEWGKKIPFKAYVASVRLLSDHTWEVLDSDGL